DGFPRLGRRQAGTRALSDLHPPWLSGPLGHAGPALPLPVPRRRLRRNRESRQRSATTAARLGRRACRRPGRRGAGAVVIARLLGGLDARAGVRGIVGVLLDEPIPPGTGWFFTLGSVLLALL